MPFRERKKPGGSSIDFFFLDIEWVMLVFSVVMGQMQSALGGVGFLVCFN